jgi:hypothetical protein
MEIEDVFATNDKVVIRYVGHGTQTGAFGKTPATGEGYCGAGNYSFSD